MQLSGGLQVTACEHSGFRTGLRSYFRENQTKALEMAYAFSHQMFCQLRKSEIIAADPLALVTRNRWPSSMVTRRASGIRLAKMRPVVKGRSDRRFPPSQGSAVQAT